MQNKKRYMINKIEKSTRRVNVKVDIARKKKKKSHYKTPNSVMQIIKRGVKFQFQKGRSLCYPISYRAPCLKNANCNSFS